MRRIGWIALALAGLLVAAGITYAASSLSTQPVGLTSEPLSAGQALAPAASATPSATPARRKHAKRQRRTRTPAPARTATPEPAATSAPVPARTVAPRPAATVEPGDDGKERGRRSGGGGDD